MNPKYMFVSTYKDHITRWDVARGLWKWVKSEVPKILILLFLIAPLAVLLAYELDKQGQLMR